MKHNVYEIIGENCITLDDGQKLYDLIHPQLLQNTEVELDFDRVVIFASPFFNAAVGQLLRDIKPEDLNRLLKLSGLSPNGAYLCRRVISNSKQYYSADQDTRDALDNAVEKQVLDN